MIDIEKERESFQAWHNKEFGIEFCDLSLTAKGNYSDAEIELEFTVWLACSEANQENIAILKEEIQRKDEALQNCKLAFEWFQLIAQPNQEMYKHEILATADLSLSRIEQALAPTKETI